MFPIQRPTPKTIVECPFKAVNALWIALFIGVVLTGVMQLDDLRLGGTVPFSLQQLLFTWVHNTLQAYLLLLFCFAVFDGGGRRQSGGNEPGVLAHVLAILGTVVIAFLFSVFSHWVRMRLFNGLGISPVIDFTIVKDSVVVVSAIAITLLLNNISQKHKDVVRREQVQREAAMARYESLVSQVNPHFLFNSLNTLSGLIGTDDDSARRYLQLLASSYRYLMQASQEVTLGEEMVFVDSYLSMMQVRYGRNLRIERRIEEDFLSLYLPPISVQMLVENAIKHNVVSDRHPLVVTLESTPDRSVRVSNLRQPKYDEPSDDPTHVGLDNLDQRCFIFCGRHVVVEQTERLFAVEVPLAVHPSPASAPQVKPDITASCTAQP